MAPKARPGHPGQLCRVVGLGEQCCGQGTRRSCKARLGGRRLCPGRVGFMAAGTLLLLGAVNQLFLSKPAGMRTGAHSRPAAAAGPPPSGSINQARPPRPERRPWGLLCVRPSQAWEAGRRASGSPGPCRVPMWAKAV